MRNLGAVIRREERGRNKMGGVGRRQWENEVGGRGVGGGGAGRGHGRRRGNGDPSGNCHRIFSDVVSWEGYLTFYHYV
jgi:hypothetical protein